MPSSHLQRNCQFGGLRNEQANSAVDTGEKASFDFRSVRINELSELEYLTLTCEQAWSILHCSLPWCNGHCAICTMVNVRRCSFPP